MVKRSERDADNSPLSNTEFKYYWDSNSTPPCAFVSCKETILTDYISCICILRVAGVSNFAIFLLRLAGFCAGPSQSASQPVSLSVCLSVCLPACLSACMCL